MNQGPLQRVVRHHAMSLRCAFFMIHFTGVHCRSAPIVNGPV
jgi:hypothetical protein